MRDRLCYRLLNLTCGKCGIGQRNRFGRRWRLLCGCDGFRCFRMAAQVIFDINVEDAAIFTGSLDDRQIDSKLFCQAAGGRRNLDSV
ncbi:MAG: hypothetical protein BWY82_02412 [Verrucomicrobia bacterium ADurb.Bin474]|nr:MAG: hypothetical protein BWY82_02412 [Verrucomicrobia bacterium ADurb.Bin474]